MSNLPKIGGRDFISATNSNNILSAMADEINNIPTANIIQQRSVAQGLPRIQQRAVVQPTKITLPNIIGNPNVAKIKGNVNEANPTLDKAKIGPEPNNIDYKDIPGKDPLYGYVNQLRKLAFKIVDDPTYIINSEPIILGQPRENPETYSHNEPIREKYLNKLEEIGNKIVIRRNELAAQNLGKNIWIYLEGKPSLDSSSNVTYPGSRWYPFYSPEHGINLVLRAIGSESHDYGSDVWQQIAVREDTNAIRFRILPGVVELPQGGRYSRYVVKYEFKDVVDLSRCQIRPELMEGGTESRSMKSKYFQETKGWGLHCVNFAMYQYFKEKLPDIEDRKIMKTLNKVSFNDDLLREVCTKELTKCASEMTKLKKKYLQDNKPIAIHLWKLREDFSKISDSGVYPRNAKPSTHEIVHIGLFDEHYIYNFMTDYRVKDKNGNYGKPLRVLNFIKDCLNEKVLIFNNRIYSEEGYRPKVIQPINLEEDQLLKNMAIKGNKFEEKVLLINDGKFGITYQNGEIVKHNEAVDEKLQKNWDKNEAMGVKYVANNSGEIKAKRNAMHKSKKAFKTRVTGYDIYVADTENSVNNKYHVFLLSAYARLEPDSDVKIQTSIKSFFNSFPKDRLNVIYFHNLKYDWDILKRSEGITSLKTIKKAGQLYQTEFKYFGKYFIFKCSYKIIPRPLRDFNEAFKLSVSKQEYILYELYTEENKLSNYVTYRPYIKGETYEVAFKDDKGYKKLLPHEIEKQDEQIIIDNRIVIPKSMIAKLPEYFNKNMYYHMSHLKYYLYYDIVTMRDGIMVYRDQMKQVTISPKYPEGQDIHNNCSLPSFAFDYLNGKGCLDNIYSVRRGTRKYLEGALYGGRVFTRLNRKWDIRGILKYFDFNSLYPSATAFLRNGIPAGKCEKMTTEYINTINNLSTKEKISELAKIPNYVVEFIITRIGIERAVGIINHNNFEDGVTRYDGSRQGLLNLLTKQHTYILEDLVEYQDIDFTLKSGLYWMEQDFTICEVFKELYAQRLIYKNNKEDLLQEMIKLIMNASLGKLAISENNSTAKYFWNYRNAKTEELRISSKNRVMNYMNANYNNIEECIEYGNIMEITTKVSEDHINMSHVMIAIYAYSKHLMNQAIFLLEDFGIEVYYSDTDSIVIQLEGKEEAFRLFSIEYKLRHGVDFEGKNLMQFKLDFPNVLAKDFYEILPEGINPKEEVFDITHAQRMIPLGRKFYYLEVPRINKRTKEEDIDYIKHAKGLSDCGIDAYERLYENNITEIYEYLYNNNNEMDKLVFDLTATGIAFEYTKDGVSTRKNFTRSIFFPEGSPKYKSENILNLESN